MNKYTVYQVADMLKTSHTTVYKKLNNKDIYKRLQRFISKDGRHTYLSGEGVEVLKNYIQLKEEFIKSLEPIINSENHVNPENVDKTNIDVLVNSLECNYIMYRVPTTTTNSK